MFTFQDGREVRAEDVQHNPDGATAWDEKTQAWSRVMRVADSDPPETKAEDASDRPKPPELAGAPRILDRFTEDVRRCGIVGEERNAATVFLVLTSRLLDGPVSAAVKGASSSGKSHTVEQVLKFFPPEAFIEMTAMSERALVYMKEDFQHRTLVLYEAVALRENVQDNLTAYFVRSLLSEGRVSYPVTVRDKRGNWTTRTIVKEGPTNIVLTTTETRLHGENETRLLSLPTDDTSEQTRRVLRWLAKDGASEPPSFTRWHKLQRWLASAEHRVQIPFAAELAESVPPVAVRLRRDFGAILNLIRAHAVLHQNNRKRDDAGRIVAAIEDYAAVRELIAEVISDGVEATVPETIRETVDAVKSLVRKDADGLVLGVQVTKVAHRLKLDKSAASRRLRGARELGYVINQEDRRGRPARYVVGEPMPEEAELLPQPDALDGSGCTVARLPEGKREAPRDAGTDQATEVPDPPADGLEAQEAALRAWNRARGVEA